MRSRSRRRRREFLLDTNATVHRKPKALRNRVLNLLVRVLLFHQLMRLLRGSWVLSTLLVLMAGFIVFAVASPYFDLKQIHISRDNPNIDAVQIETALQDFYGQNLLFLSHSALKETLFDSFPEFREVRVSENWPNALSLEIKISPPLFTLLNHESANFSVISEDGVILHQQPDDTLPVVRVMDWKKLIVPGMQFASTAELQKILLAKNATENDLKLFVKELIYFPIAHELHLVVQGDGQLWIDLRLDIRKQLRKLELSANEIGIYKQPFDHIDLRIPKQIFWEPR